jgi:hypothetical protein
MEDSCHFEDMGDCNSCKTVTPRDRCRGICDTKTAPQLTLSASFQEWISQLHEFNDRTQCKRKVGKNKVALCSQHRGMQNDYKNDYTEQILQIQQSDPMMFYIEYLITDKTQIPHLMDVFLSPMGILLLNEKMWMNFFLSVFTDTNYNVLAYSILSHKIKNLQYDSHLILRLVQNIVGGFTAGSHEGKATLIKPMSDEIMKDILQNNLENHGFTSWYVLNALDKANNYLKQINHDTLEVMLHRESNTPGFFTKSVK